MTIESITLKEMAALVALSSCMKNFNHLGPEKMSEMAWDIAAIFVNKSPRSSNGRSWINENPGPPSVIP